MKKASARIRPQLPRQIPAPIVDRQREQLDPKAESRRRLGQFEGHLRGSKICSGTSYTGLRVAQVEDSADPELGA